MGLKSFVKYEKDRMGAFGRISSSRLSNETVTSKSKLGACRSSSRLSDRKPGTLNNDSMVVSKLPNPDPHNCEIKRYLAVGKYLIVEIYYPDCTNFEGNKILVFETTIAKLKKQKAIDPHFSQSRKYIHPIARFIPTSKGWDMAFTLCKTLIEKV